MGNWLREAQIRQEAMLADDERRSRIGRRQEARRRNAWRYASAYRLHDLFSIEASLRRWARADRGAMLREVPWPWVAQTWRRA